jgi:branched-chain amino acid transport system substrate-binding protein
VIGAGVAPSALAIAPVVTQGKVATVIMIAGTSIVIGRSPYFVRTSFTLGQSSSSALERARDLKPDTLFVFVPASGQAGAFAKQFVERGFVKAGIKLIGPGDITDDDDLPAMSDAMLGVVTAGNYSADHQSAMNTKYIEDFKKAYNLRPNFISVGGWDGMHAIYEALKKTGGSTDGDSLVEAMRGMSWESPRGPISIDLQTREIVQNIYIRKVEKKNGELYNVEFATFEAVKDPSKASK